MHPTLRGVDRDRLERSCGPGQDAIRFGAGAPGLQRAAVRLRSCRFSLHRHDSYAIGITTTGVQSFRYRGSRHICLPGQLHVLYPDELHDGAAATIEGFGYRIAYVDPELVRDALGGGALPFAAEPVHDVTARMAPMLRLLADIDDPIDDVARPVAVAMVASILCELAGQPGGDAGGSLDLAAVARVREHLAAHAREQTPAAELERIAGLDRYTIARQFRRAYGTSPDRFRTMRRLGLVRAAIGQGRPLAEAALEAGFSDQSHMTRQFRRAYGLTRGGSRRRWRPPADPADGCTAPGARIAAAGRAHGPAIRRRSSAGRAHHS